MCKGPEVGWSLLGWRDKEEPEGAGADWRAGKEEALGEVSRDMTMRSDLVFRVPWMLGGKQAVGDTHREEQGILGQRPVSLPFSLNIFHILSNSLCF